MPAALHQCAFCGGGWRAEWLGGISVCRGSDEDSSSGLSAKKLVSEGLVLALALAWWRLPVISAPN